MNYPVKKVNAVRTDLTLHSTDYTYLTRPNALRSLQSFASDWLLIVITLWLLLEFGFWLLPLSLVVIGSRQRALSNLVHDAAHSNLFTTKKINDGIANWFAAYWMFDSVKNYRKNHLKHHQHLGSPNLDPDSVTHFRYGYDDCNPAKGTPLKIYWALILSFHAWKDSVCGALFTLDLKSRILILCLYSLVASTIWYFCGLQTTASILGIWILARITTYHAIRIFAEFLDHGGLKSKSIIEFTRNLPHRGLLTSCFHPHCDTYHLVHHLFPKIPHYRLHRAHVLLSAESIYLTAHHCDSYFAGSHSAMSCLCGECRKEGIECS